MIEPAKGRPPIQFGFCLYRPIHDVEIPFIVNNISPDRSSGLLTPTFSINDIVRTSQSYSRRVSNMGFYWAINDYMDATVAVDWWSGQVRRRLV